MAFPLWAIGIIILVIIIFILTTVYVVYRKKSRKNKAAVGAQDEEKVLEKNVAPSSSAPINPLYNETIITFESNTTSIPQYDKIEEDTSKFTLPLPPPDASFLSDKMELDSTEANDLYMAYMAASQSETIDEKPFLSNAAANIQQKAATLRSTLRQSIRRKPAYKNTVAPGLFDTPSLKSSIDDRMSRQSSVASSRFPRASLQTTNLLPPSPVIDSLSTLDSFADRYSNSSSRKSLVRQEEDTASTKIMVDVLHNPSYFSLPMSPITPSSPTPDYSNVVEEINQYTDVLDIESDEEEQQETHEQSQAFEEDEANESPQEAASAARKLIRSASRKSRRSTVTHEDTGDVLAYATVRGKKPSVQKIDTNSVRITGRPDIQKWSSESPSTSSPRRMNSDLSENQEQPIILNESVSQETTKEPTSLKDLFSEQVAPAQPTTTKNVDTIRRMLQSSWSGNNIKESGSNSSLSDVDAGSQRAIVSPLGSVNPRLQNQHLVSLSLKAGNSQSARARPSMPSGFMPDVEGPTPTISFSSSTVRTMIPAEEENKAQKKGKGNHKKTTAVGNMARSKAPSRLGMGKTPAQKEREKYLKSLETH